MLSSDARDAEEALGLLDAHGHDAVADPSSASGQLDMPDSSTASATTTTDAPLTSLTTSSTPSPLSDATALPPPPPIPTASPPYSPTAAAAPFSAKRGAESHNSSAPAANGRPVRVVRQSSFAQPRPDGTPRTANRVRFDEEAELIPLSTRTSMTSNNSGGQTGANGHVGPGAGRSGQQQHPYATRTIPLAYGEEGDEDLVMGEGDGDDAWVEGQDFMGSGNRTNGGGRGFGLGLGRGRGSGRTRSGSGEQRLPLLTDVEAPSVTVAGGEGEFEEALDGVSRPKSGLKSAFMNMANSIIGAGIIGQPYAFKQAGLLTGIILLVGLTITVDWTIRLIVINSKLSGANSFQATVQHCFGSSGLIAISVAQWVFAFGGMVAFCVIIGDTIPHVMEALFPSLPDKPFLWLLTDRRAIIVLFVLGISYPLSLYRDIAKLAKASTFALISMIVIIVTVLTQGYSVPKEMKGQITGSLIINDGVFQAIGVISFAFVCHHNSLLIYGSLKKPTLDRFAKVTHFSTTVSMIACLFMALGGYLSFGNKTQGNVLNNFPTNNILVNIARLCFGLNMLTTLPLEAFVCREVMENYYFPGEAWDGNRHMVFTTTLVVSAMGLSLLTCDLGAVFELIGATSATALAYILPPLCYLKLSSPKKSGRGRLERMAAYACVGFGCAVLAVSLVLAVVKLGKNEGGVKAC
ncbi:putative amino acid transporter [Phyllosticta capitalensis]